MKLPYTLLNYNMGTVQKILSCCTLHLNLGSQYSEELGAENYGHIDLQPHAINVFIYVYLLLELIW